jgi:hypothetical protein
MAQVISLEQDLAQRWYARVVISPEETTFLKFFNKPTQEEIDIAVQSYIDARANNGEE